MSKKWYEDKLNKMGWFSNYLPKTVRGKYKDPTLKAEKQKRDSIRRNSDNKHFEDAIKEAFE